jgi:hypothetical protein
MGWHVRQHSQLDSRQFHVHLHGIPRLLHDLLRDAVVPIDTGTTTTSPVAFGTATNVLAAGTISGNLTLGGDSLFWITDLNSPLTVGVGKTLSFTGDGGGFGIDRLANIDWETVLAGTYTLISGNVDFTNIRNVGLENAFALDSGDFAYFQEGSLQLVITPVPEPATVVSPGPQRAASN